MGITKNILSRIGLPQGSPRIASRARRLSDPLVRTLRNAIGGALTPRPHTHTRWYMRDVESAEFEADQGTLRTAAKIMRSARGDGTYSGVLSTRTGGLVRLPRQFKGAEEIVRRLEGTPDDARSLFEEMCPSAELALLAADGLELGVGVAELVEIPGRKHPRLTRLDPQFLRYEHDIDQWVYDSVAGPVAVVPGDGWVLHMPGGRVNPWDHGIWRAVARAYVRKTHADSYKDNWESKLAHPARVATTPHGATEEQSDAWFQQVMAWGVNTVFGMRPGYDVKLVESNGRGHESFDATISRQNDELKMAVAGQLVTSDGGAGFQNSDIHRSIRADLIKETADALSETISQQVLSLWVLEEFGVEAFDDGVSVAWDVTPPKDRASEAAALTAVGSALTQVSRSFGAFGLRVDARALAAKFGIPLTDSGSESPLATLEPAVLVELAAQLKLGPAKATVIALAAQAGIPMEELPEGAEPVRLSPPEPEPVQEAA